RRQGCRMTAVAAPDHAGRRDRLREVLRARDLHGAVVTDLVNVRYLTGFTGSNAAVLVEADGQDLLATDGRYTEQAAAESPEVELLVERECAEGLLARAANDGRVRVAFEAH